MSNTSNPIEICLDEWHKYVRGDHEILDTLLHDDAVFYSPVVFRPQEGKDITKLYLLAAAGAFGDDKPVHATLDTEPTPGEWDGTFRYTSKLHSGNMAVLQFESTIKGKYINGIDMITCDSNGKITEFKVMIRPLQAIEVIRDQMVAMMAALSS